MTQRYYVPDLPAAGGTVIMSGTEARHATRVMRARPGDAVTLFDGRGHEAEATIAETSRNECACRAGQAEAVDRDPRCRTELAVALPKGDRARELIERLTELGVARVTPVVAARSQRGYSDSRLDKLRRTVIESSKQCGRNRLMEIEEPIDAADYFARASTISSATRWIAHPHPQSAALAAAPGGDHVLAAIGPEGGWTAREFAAAIDNGFIGVDLAPRIYRIETAAVVVAARTAGA